MLEKPEPLDVEINVPNGIPIMVKTDHTGTIEYANLTYADISGYAIEEIIGQDVSVLCHPDMPTTIYDHIWESLFKKKRTYAILKNISKSGKYFWLQVKFDFRVNENTREIENIYAYYSKVSNTVKNEIATLYEKIKIIEKHSGVDVAENYLQGFLDEKSLTYNEYIEKYIQ